MLQYNYIQFLKMKKNAMKRTIFFLSNIMMIMGGFSLDHSGISLLSSDFIVQVEKHSPEDYLMVMWRCCGAGLRGDVTHRMRWGGGNVVCSRQPLLSSHLSADSHHCCSSWKNISRRHQSSLVAPEMTVFSRVSVTKEHLICSVANCR